MDFIIGIFIGMFIITSLNILYVNHKLNYTKREYLAFLDKAWKNKENNDRSRHRN